MRCSRRDRIRRIRRLVFSREESGDDQARDDQQRKPRPADCAVGLIEGCSAGGEGGEVAGYVEGGGEEVEEGDVGGG